MSAFQFKASEEFWKNFHALDFLQKEAVRDKWKTFEENPFHPSLGTHKINRLSSLRRRTVYAVRIENDLRVIFEIGNGNQVFTIDVGTHDVYR